MGNRIHSPAALWAMTALVALASAGCASQTEEHTSELQSH